MLFDLESQYQCQIQFLDFGSFCLTCCFVQVWRQFIHNPLVTKLWWIIAQLFDFQGQGHIKLKVTFGDIKMSDLSYVFSYPSINQICQPLTNLSDFLQNSIICHWLSRSHKGQCQIQFDPPGVLVQSVVLSKSEDNPYIITKL